MQLNRLISDSELPSALKRPLVFGDRKQISATYELAAIIEEIETEQAKIAGGTSKYYNVEIEYTGTFEIKVLAESEADARDKARMEADIPNVDIEEDFITVRSVKKCQLK